MKIRDGFVSNSSSSSFVIAIEEVPKDRKQLRFGMMILDDTIACSELDMNYDANKIASRLLKDIKKSKPITDWKDILNVMLRGTCYNNMLPESGDFDSWDDYFREYKRSSRILAKMFAKNNSKRKIFILEYDDKSDIECCIESGEPFKYVRHMKISHH